MYIPAWLLLLLVFFFAPQLLVLALNAALVLVPIAIVLALLALAVIYPNTVGLGLDAAFLIAGVLVLLNALVWLWVRRRAVAVVWRAQNPLTRLRDWAVRTRWWLICLALWLIASYELLHRSHPPEWAWVSFAVLVSYPVALIVNDLLVRRQTKRTA